VKFIFEVIFVCSLARRLEHVYVVYGLWLVSPDSVLCINQRLALSIFHAWTSVEKTWTIHVEVYVNNVRKLTKAFEVISTIAIEDLSFSNETLLLRLGSVEESIETIVWLLGGTHSATRKR
jgi:hypothetical protein